MCTDKLFEEIVRLNPDVTFEWGEWETVFSSRPPAELELPIGFYYNTKNGVTNKHNTESGMYICLNVVC